MWTTRDLICRHGCPFPAVVEACRYRRHARVLACVAPPMTALMHAWLTPWIAQHLACAPEHAVPWLELHTQVHTEPNRWHVGTAGKGRAEARRVTGPHS